MFGLGSKKEELEPAVQRKLPIGGQKPKPKKPPKPWGKKERYLVATILAVTVIASLVGFVASQGFSMPELYLPDISTDKTIEIEK